MGVVRLVVTLAAALSTACDSEYGLEAAEDWHEHLADELGSAEASLPQSHPPELAAGGPADLTEETEPGTDRLEPDPFPPTPDTGLATVDCVPGVALTAWLDDQQTPDDGAVSYCHSGGGGAYHILDTSVSSCMPHLDHPYDVFPTTGCDS